MLTAQPAFLCFSLPGQGDWQFPALTTWRTLSFLVITKVPEMDGAIRLKVLELVKAVARLGTPDTQRTPGGTPTACVTVGGQSASSPRASPTPA